MREITMFQASEKSFMEVYEEFVISRIANGAASSCLRDVRLRAL